jgi:hypothetical protein
VGAEAAAAGVARRLRYAAGLSARSDGNVSVRWRTLRRSEATL